MLDFIQVPTTKQCCHCHQVMASSNFYKNSYKKYGLSSRCKKCDSEYAKDRAKKKDPSYGTKENQIKKYNKIQSNFYKKYNLKPSEEVRQARSKFSYYKHDTFQHNLSHLKHREFHLSFQQFYDIIKKPCYYCGSKNSLNGIDRMDSEKSYKIGNCVSCCTICNRMKNNSNAIDFIFQVHRIYKHCKKAYNIQEVAD